MPTQTRLAAPPCLGRQRRKGLGTPKPARRRAARRRAPPRRAQAARIGNSAGVPLGTARADLALGAVLAAGQQATIHAGALRGRPVAVKKARIGTHQVRPPGLWRPVYATGARQPTGCRPACGRLQPSEAGRARPR